MDPADRETPARLGRKVVMFWGRDLPKAAQERMADHVANEVKRLIAEEREACAAACEALDAAEDRVSGRLCAAVIRGRGK